MPQPAGGGAHARSSGSTSAPPWQLIGLDTAALFEYFRCGGKQEDLTVRGAP